MSKLTHLIYVSIIAILSVAILWLARSPSVDTVRDTDADVTISSIAVLPFITLQNDESTMQLAESITDEIVETLGNVPNLTIASRDKTKALLGTHLNIREIGEELSVETILEGSVRQINDRVRVTVQLIDARTDEHLQAVTFDRSIDDRDSLVAEIVRAIMPPTRD